MQGQSSRGGGYGDLPWLTFPQITSKSSLDRAKNKLRVLRRKEIYAPNKIDWNRVGQTGLEEELTPYLVKSSEHEGMTIVYDGWSRLFKIQEPIYQELCWEFFSTISF